jgi:PTS system nitrogen regulatory IIA component
LDHQLIAFGLSRKGVDFDAMDGKPAKLFFLLIAPEESVGIHLKTLARISKLLKTSHARERLQSATDRQQIHRIIAEEEENL